MVKRGFGGFISTCRLTWQKVICYFGFTPNEIKGLRVLFAIYLIFLIWQGCRRYFGGEEYHRIPEDHLNVLADIIDAQIVSPASQEEIVLRPFDPNTLDEAGWRSLGLSARQAQGILNYTSKGGQFRRKEDLRKMYSLRPEDYERLEPYISIESATAFKSSFSQKTPSSSEESSKERFRRGFERRNAVISDRDHYASAKLLVEPPSIELNTADTALLQQLPGLGPVFASRIVRFRSLLGGFHDVNQLLEVYGMDTVRFARFRAFLELDTSKIARLDINGISYDSLRRHPLVGSKLAARIINYRDHHGPFRKIEEIKDIADEREQIPWEKILPYLGIK